MNQIKYNIKKFLKNNNIGYKHLINWNSILNGENKTIFEDLKFKSNKDETIIISTTTGGHLVSSHFDTILASALIKNGKNVEFLLCDSTLEACQQSTSHFIPEKIFKKDGPKSLCESCYHSGLLVYEKMGIKVNKLGDHISLKEKEDIDNSLDKLAYAELLDYKDNEIDLAEDALSGALRYYAVGTLENEPYKEEVLRKYLKSAIITKIAFKNLIKKKNFSTVVLNHGIYVPQGTISKIAKLSNINVVCYQPSYKTNCFTLSHDTTYHLTMMDEPVSYWENIEWNENLDQRLIKYLYSRRFGKNDWEYYFTKPEFNIHEKFEEYGLDVDKPIIGMLTNIIWDALLTYPNNIFKNMLEWIFKTIDYFVTRPDLQLAIRVHPAEVNSDRVSKQKVLEEIKKKYTELPKNIIVIDSKDNLSTYAFADICDSIIIYSTKMGMEFSPLGIPVICAGESYVRNKGITYDPKSQSEYLNILKNLPMKNKLSAEKVLRAKKYAYHFFFRRSIPISSINHKRHSWPPFNLDKKGFKKILDGKDLGLEQICNSIIDKKPFIFEDEKY